MSKQKTRRNALKLAMTLTTFALGVLAAVFVVGSAAASGPATTTSSYSSPPPSYGAAPMGMAPMVPNTPQAQFLVVNGSVSATSDHEIVGSSAFPNYTTGAVDNYYTMSKSHLDNSPFNEATSSPFDTGPIGQTAAAGNTQQPQYADARWPGGPDSATYGTKGQPFALSSANMSLAGASAYESSNGLKSPGLHGSKLPPAPKGLDKKLAAALAGWKAKFLGCPAVPAKPPLPQLPTPTVPTVTTPKPPTVTVRTPTVSTPVITVPVPSTSKSAPPAPAPAPAPTPPLPTASASSAPRSLSAVPSPCASSGSSRPDGESHLSSSTLGLLVPGDAAGNDNINGVETSKLQTTEVTTTTTTEDTTTMSTNPNQTTTIPGWTPKPYTLMMAGSSSVGRVVLGGGQIVIDGIRVTASVNNDGSSSPSYKANVAVASASIGGIPVTIDQSGVHVATQHQSLPYKQASDSLNTALKQAGIQIFLMKPQVINCDPGKSGSSTTTTTTSDQSSSSNPCAQAAPPMTSSCGSDMGMGTGTGTDTTSSSPSPTPAPTSTTTSTDQSSTMSPDSSCAPPPDACGGMGTFGGPSTYGGTSTTSSTTTTSTDQSGMSSGGCPPPDACGGTGMSAGGSTPTGSSTTTGTTTTTSTGQTDTTSMASSSCGPPPLAPGCPTAGKKGKGRATTTTTSTTQTGTTDVPPPPPPPPVPSAGQQLVVRATGVHIVFTQPFAPSGAPAQYVEHIVGDVYLNSLAAPATPILPQVIPGFGASAGGFGTAGSGSAASPCAFGKGSHSKLKSMGGGGGGGAAGSAGGSSSTGGLAGGASGTGSLAGAGSGSSLGSGSESGLGSSGGGGQSLPAAFASVLKKPLWLLLAYLVWQVLVVGTGWSLWKWRKGEAE